MLHPHLLMYTLLPRIKPGIEWKSPCGQFYHILQIRHRVLPLLLQDRYRLRGLLAVEQLLLAPVLIVLSLSLHPECQQKLVVVTPQAYILLHQRQLQTLFTSHTLLMKKSMPIRPTLHVPPRRLLTRLQHWTFPLHHRVHLLGFLSALRQCLPEEQVLAL